MFDFVTYLPIRYLISRTGTVTGTHRPVSSFLGFTRVTYPDIVTAAQKIIARGLQVQGNNMRHNPSLPPNKELLGTGKHLFY
jgi:hypothetical protein